MSDHAQRPDARYRSRKFLITCSALLLASGFLGFDKITGEEWTSIALTCVGAYNLTNALSGALRAAVSAKRSD